MRDGGGPRVREKPNAPKKGASDARLLRAEGCEVNLSGRRCGQPDAEKGGERDQERKELTPISTRRGSFLMSGCGGGGPGENSRQMPAKKQKALNSASTVPAASTTMYSGMTSFSAALAPTPLASAARPVRTQAA